MADFQLDLSTHLNALKEEKIIKLEDLEDIMDNRKILMKRFKDYHIQKRS